MLRANTFTMSKITSYFSNPKKPKLDEDAKKCATPMETDLPESSLPTSSSVTPSSSNDDIKEGDSQWPNCWSFEQKGEFCKKYNWLIVHDKKLGCEVCRSVKSLGVEKKLV